MGFIGKTIYYSYLFSDRSTAWVDKDVYKNVFFTDKVKVSTAVEVGTATDIYTADFTENQLRIDFHDAGMFTRAPFNGILIDDKDKVLEPIAGFSLVTNVKGLDRSDIQISTDGERLSINWQGASFSNNSYAWITLSFGRNAVLGDDRANTLKGTTGNDLVTGGKGADTLSGLSGSDVFVFAAGDTGNTNATADTILDFKPGERDLIDVTRIDADGGKAGNQHFTFVGTTAFSRHAGELRYDKLSSDVYIQGDTNGDGKADFIIHLDDPMALVKSAFLL